MNQKGANTIFTGIMVLVLSVFVMIIVIGLVTPYFTNLNDGIKFKNNKETILSLNEQLLNLKDKGTGSIIEININPVSNLEIDHINNKIIITQEINNPRNNFKEQIYNNLTITKQNNAFLFVLDLNGIVTLDKSIILSQSRQKLKFEIGEITFGVPSVILNKTSGTISRVILTPQNSYFSAEQIITALATPFDSNIYYTVDGTEPDQNSTLYTEPITITETTTIKFKAYKDNYDPSITVTGIYTKINGLLFFNKYNEENPLFDLSGNNNNVINNNVLFGINGASFNNNFNKYLFVENDWNDSHPELALGNNNFTMEAFVSSGYKGHIFSKTGVVGGMDLSINDEGIVDFSFSGNDQLYLPHGITTDENYIYISEYGNHRIQKRRKDNWELVLMSGGPRATSAIDGYYTPYGLANDENYIYISDYSNCRIVKRNKEDFSFVSMLSNGCGLADNQIRYNYDVAVDDEYIYVSEYSYNRIKKFDKETFAYVSKIGGTAAGTGNTQFNRPRGVAVDDTYLYVADSYNHRIKKHLKSNLSFVSSVGSTNGSGDDQFYYPYYIDLDENYIYISDYTNARIMIRNKDETMSYFNKITSSGLYPDDEYLYGPTGIAVDENYIYVSEYTNQRLKKYDKTELTVSSIFSKILPGDESLISPVEITNDGENIYYTDIGLHRVVKRRMSDMKVTGVIGGPYAGTTTTLLNSPYGIAVKGNNLYVADYGNNAIKIFNKDTLEWVYTCVPGTGFFRYPRGIAYDENYFYVTTTYSSTMDSLHKLEITDSSCTAIQTIGGTNGNDENSFTEPHGVAVDDEFVYVADVSNYRIKKHRKSDLSYVSQLGITGYANQYINTINGAYGILIDNNYLYVSNDSYQTIRKYTTDFNYISSIGYSSGFAPDEFLSPRGMTVADEQMYILDYTLGKVTKRDLKEFDTNIELTEAGTDFNFFYKPLASDFDEEYYYLANYYIHRLEKRKISDNSLVKSFGGLLPGGSNELLHYPTDVVLDGNFVYVVETSNQRIIKLEKENLTYISQYGVTNSAGSTSDRFNAPRKLAIDENYLYITDYTNNRIKILNKEDLSYFKDFGSLGTGIDNFSGPYGIAVDDNYIYISEYGNNRIQKRDKTSLVYISHIGGTDSGSGEDQFYRPYDLVVDDTYIYVTDTWNNRIKKHLKEDLNFVTTIGEFGANDSQFYRPSGIKYKYDKFYITDSENSRIQIFESSDFSFKDKIDLSTYTTGGFYIPRGIAIDDNYLYVVDSDNHRIVKKEKDTLLTVNSIGGPLYGSGQDQFYSPYGIAVDDNYIYVNDYTNCRIVKRNKETLEYVSALSNGCGSANTQVRYNMGIAVDDNYIYIIEYSYNRIKKFDKNTFAFVAKIGGTGVGQGDDEFYYPRGIAVDDNYVYVADSSNHRIHKRDKETLELVAMYGVGAAALAATNGFNNPYSVHVSNNKIYVADYSYHRIKVFDINFNFLYKFGRYGWGPDLLYYPSDVAVDNENVYISDSSNHRIVKRSLSNLDYLENIPKTNSFGVWGYNSNMLSSLRRITTDSQIVLKRTGNEFCIYINGEKDNCNTFENTPTNLTFPESNTRYGSSATTTTHYLSENQNNYPFAIGNYGLVTPGNGTIKYFRIYDSNLSDSEILGLYENYK